MSEEATNTQKIQTLVAKIPSLSEAWSNAIEDQNDDTISEAWIATVEHFFPDTEDLNPESVLELLKSKELPCKNPSDFYHPINLIADILVGLTDDLCFGEMERLLDYCGLEPEGECQRATCDQQVRQWLNSGRLKPNQIAILSARKQPNSSLSQVKTLGGVPMVDSLSDWKEGKEVLYSTVRAFKGLEADPLVVMNIGRPTPILSQADFYVACSRAKHLLTVLTTTEGVL